MNYRVNGKSVVHTLSTRNHGQGIFTLRSQEWDLDCGVAGVVAGFCLVETYPLECQTRHVLNRITFAVETGFLPVLFFVLARPLLPLLRNCCSS